MGRIVVMQIAVIVGAMLAQTYGTQAPMLIVIGLKTLFDFGGSTARNVQTEIVTTHATGGSVKTSVRLPD